MHDVSYSCFSIITWVKHPFQKSSEVEVNKLSRRQIYILIVSVIAVTVIFYFILKYLGNANLLFSTVSVATSFIASYLTLFRSPFYAIGYAANDIVLIVCGFLPLLKTFHTYQWSYALQCFWSMIYTDLLIGEE